MITLYYYLLLHKILSCIIYLYCSISMPFLFALKIKFQSNKMIIKMCIIFYIQFYVHYLHIIY